MLAPQTATLRERFRFFLEWQGYCTPPGRAACALEAAKREAAACDRDDIRFRWEYEDPQDIDLSWDEQGQIGRRLDSGTLVALYCVLERLCDSCGSWDHVDSVGNIIVPIDWERDPYCRCVEADMLANLED